MTQLAAWHLWSEHHLPPETITALEGRLCLGLVNTFHPRSGRRLHDALTKYGDLVAWYRSLGMLTEQQERHLLRVASAHPREAHRSFERAIALREASFRVFSSVAARMSPQSEDLGLLRDAMAEAMAHATLAPMAHEFMWELGDRHGHGEELHALLWPAAYSAIELFTDTAQRERLKECPGCGWLFLDASKIGNRRWCSMDACGSRDKMRRLYARKRAER